MAGGGELQNKHPQVPGIESSSKKTMVLALSASPTCPVSGGVMVKQEPSEWGAGVHGGGVPRASARAAAAVEQANPPAELLRINGSLELSLLHCAVAGCHRPLKPPVFKCEAGHRLCSSCYGGGGGGGEGHCRKCDRASAFVSCGPNLDVFVGGFRVPCPLAYGCGVSVVYHDAAAHRDACACAPCPCALCAFTAPPRMLRDHLAADHAWRVDALPSYGKPLQLRVPASEAHCLLVVEGDERGLFVLSVRALGLGADIWAWVVSVACVRVSAEAGPRYVCVLWAQTPAAPGVPAAKGRFLQMRTDMASCAVPGGAAVEEGMTLLVPPQMVQGPSKEIHLGPDWLPNLAQPASHHTTEPGSE